MEVAGDVYQDASSNDEGENQPIEQQASSEENPVRCLDCKERVWLKSFNLFSYRKNLASL